MVAAKFSVLMRSASSSPAASLTKAVPPTISAFRETSGQDFDCDVDDGEKGKTYDFLRGEGKL